MTKIRSRILGGTNKFGDFLIQRGMFPRITNGLMALILAGTVAIMMIAGEGLSNTGIIVFSLLFIATIYNTGENTKFEFSRNRSALIYTRSFFGIPLKRAVVPISSLKRIMLSGVEFDVKGVRRQNPGLYRLQVRIDRELAGEQPDFIESKLTLEDSSDSQELSALGRGLASYLNLDFEVSTGV